jgi:hypothetical protein
LGFCSRFTPNFIGVNFDSDRWMICKAQAAVILRWRGHQVFSPSPLLFGQSMGKFRGAIAESRGESSQQFFTGELQNQAGVFFGGQGEDLRDDRG